MQTFLPYTSFKKCASVLDWRRLGCQRKEANQILSILLGEAKSTSWQNHPAVLMWKGYEKHLIGYRNTIITEWLKRGYNNNMPFVRPAIYEAPPWVSKVVKSHRSKLLQKDYDWYSQYGWNVPLDLEYHWPVRKNVYDK